MENDNIYKHMALHDCNKPVEVQVFLIEDSDEEKNTDSTQSFTETNIRSKRSKKCTTPAKRTKQIQENMKKQKDDKLINNTDYVCKMQEFNDSNKLNDKLYTNYHSRVMEIDSQSTAINENIPLTLQSKEFIPTYTRESHLVSLLDNMLRQISNNLYNIIVAQYNLIHSQSKSQNDFKLCRKQFHTVKYHNFYLSHCTIQAIIIPERKRLPIFDRNFLTKTLSMIYAKQRAICSYQDLEFLYFEMLSWSQEHKLKYENNDTKKTSNNESDLILRQILRAPPFHPPSVVTESDIQNTLTDTQAHTDLNKKQTVVYKSGPPHREVSIGVDKSLINSINTNNNEVQIPYERVTFDHFPTRRQDCIVKTSYDQDWERRITAAAMNCQNIPPIYTIADQMNLNKEYPTQVPNPELTIQNNIKPSRSVSRDSGFMSPNLNQTNILPKSSNTPILQSPSQTIQQTPQNYNEYLCRVCLKLTRKVCLSCYKVPYCSTECQKADWKNHMESCFDKC